MASLHPSPRQVGRCELCGRAAPDLTRHHLVPRSQHDKRYARERFTKDEMQRRLAWLCRPCHQYIHTVFSERELGTERNSVAALLQHPEVRRFIGWLAGKPDGFLPRVNPMKRSRRA